MTNKYDQFKVALENLTLDTKIRDCSFYSVFD